MSAFNFITRIRAASGGPIPILCRRRRFSAATSLIPGSDQKTSIPAIQNTKTVISLLKAEEDPNRIIQICRSAALMPEIYLDRVGFSVAVDKLSKDEHYEAIEEIIDGFLKSRSDLTERVGAHAIVLYGQANMLDHAIRTFMELDQLGIRRTVKSLNSLIFACLLVKNHKEAKRIYYDFPKMYGIKPDLETYNTMIKVFCDSGSASTGFSIVAEMERKEIKPTATTFGIMLASLYKEEKYDVVKNVLKFMKKRGVNVGVSTWNIRIQSLCKLKKSIEAKALLTEMLSRGMKPNSVTYCHLIHGFCREGNLDEAKKLFNSMGNRGFKPDSECYFTLLNYLCQAGDFETALSVCNESMAKNWVPKFGIMKSLVCGLVSISKIDAAKELVTQVKERFPQNVHVWNDIEASFDQ